jgi:NAD(P)-dependent dehydrogenase (short-subunit alcohol dehydrogenase family)
MMQNLFDLTGKVAIITGGAGLLGQQHAQAIAKVGGIPVIADVNTKAVKGWHCTTDITDPQSVQNALEFVLHQIGRVDILINNAAHNSETGAAFTFEDSGRAQWDDDIEVGLTGAYLCSRIIGGYMAGHGGGVIVNIGSDFANIAPDPRCYAPKVKPASYSVVKHGLLGLTKYLAAYWGDKGVRVNMLSPGGVENGQGAEFIGKIAERVPMGRMARANEYQAAIQFLCSDASSYMTGHNLIMDGGRSIW